MNEERKSKPFITISILLRGDRLDPIFVSNALGIQAINSQTKGETRGGVRPGSKKYVTKIGIWRTEVEGECRTVADLVGEMLQKFDARQEPLDKIEGVDEACLDILVLNDRSNETDDTTEFVLRKDHVRRASQLGLAVWITIS